MSRLRPINKTHASIPRVRFGAIKDTVLGKDYVLSLAFVPPAHMRKLNLIYRGIDRATDILSFPLDRKQGEIYICPSETRRMAPEFDRTYQDFMGFLFIHGCVHLKGYDHSATMETIESRFRKRFGVKVS